MSYIKITIFCNKNFHKDVNFSVGVLYKNCLKIGCCVIRFELKFFVVFKAQTTFPIAIATTFEIFSVQLVFFISDKLFKCYLDKNVSVKKYFIKNKI